MKDADGDLILAKLERIPLQQIAAFGGGVYSEVGVDDSDIDVILNALSVERMAQTSKLEQMASDVWRDRGPWLLLPLLVIAALAFRRGALLLALVACLPFPQPAAALDWEALWLRPDQLAMREFEAGDTERAAELFEDPSWKAAAQYRAGKFEEAADTLVEPEDRTSAYNRGNALARLGRYQKAIESYESVLVQDPEHEDARFNRDLLQQLMQQQNESQENASESADADDNGEQGESTSPQSQAEGSDSDAQTDGPRSDTGQGESEQALGEDTASEQDSGARKDTQSAADEQHEAQAERESTEASDPQEQDSQGGMEAEALADGSEDESTQATEQWLRRIPDDPGGLLRRKFLYQYKRQAVPPAGREARPW